MQSTHSGKPQSVKYHLRILLWLVKQYAGSDIRGLHSILTIYLPGLESGPHQYWFISISFNDCAAFIGCPGNSRNIATYCWRKLLTAPMLYAAYALAIKRSGSHIALSTVCIKPKVGRMVCCQLISVRDFSKQSSMDFAQYLNFAESPVNIIASARLYSSCSFHLPCPIMETQKLWWNRWFRRKVTVF